jgi:hypothetical protein
LKLMAGREEQQQQQLKWRHVGWSPSTTAKQRAKQQRQLLVALHFELAVQQSPASLPIWTMKQTQRAMTS